MSALGAVLIAMLVATTTYDTIVVILRWRMTRGLRVEICNLRRRMAAIQDGQFRFVETETCRLMLARDCLALALMHLNASVASGEEKSLIRKEIGHATLDIEGVYIGLREHFARPEEWPS